MSTHSMNFAHVLKQGTGAPNAPGQPGAAGKPGRGPDGLARAAEVLWAGGWRTLAALLLAGLLWVL